MKLPINDVNTQERMASESEKAIDFIAKQILWNKGRRKNNVVASIRSGNATGPISYTDELAEALGYRKEPFFDEDVIRNVINEIIKSGYFAWIHSDYENHISLWVTNTDCQPHPWFSRCYCQNETHN